MIYKISSISKQFIDNHDLYVMVNLYIQINHIDGAITFKIKFGLDFN